MRGLSLLLFTTVALFGCGGGEPAEPKTGVTSGAEQVAAEPEPTEPEEVVEEEVEPEPPPSGPAHVTYAFVANGQPVEGVFKVRADTGEVLAEGKTGERVELPSGEYRVECTADKKVLVDGPTEWDALSLEAGDDIEQKVEFPWAKVRLVVKVNGKDASGSVTLMRRGKEVATLPIAAEEHALMSPGRYSAKVKTRRSEIEVPEIVIPGESTRNVPINVSF